MKNGENNGVLAGVPFLSPSHAQIPLPLPLPLLTPATQASVMSSLNDIIQTIEKKLNNTHTENEEMIVAVNGIYAIA